MSCSYGPGRYDLNYEEHGIDYPYGYVRWTEKRNMEAFQELIRKETINLKYLTTHEFKLKDSHEAYEMILKNESYLGLLIKYEKTTKKITETIKKTSNLTNTPKVNISFIGAGSYAQGNLIPYLKNEKS